MSYFCKRDSMSYFYKRDNIEFTVYVNDKDKTNNIVIFLFFYDDSQYIGAVRYHVGGRYYNIIDDYTNNVVNIDFEEEVQYFFDIIYGLDR